MGSVFLPLRSVVQSTLIARGCAAAAIAAALAICAAPANATLVPPQQVPQATPRPDAPTVAVTGTVSAADGSAIPGLDVFLLETLEGTTSDEAGRFVIRSKHRGPATLVAHGPGHHQERLRLVLPHASPVDIVMAAQTVRLQPISVRAGSYAAGQSESVTALEVVSIPGAQADVLQAVASFPGVQPVEEGAALFVRGGDVAETKVVLDGAVVLAPYRFESAQISFGTFDPFELEGIAFSSGGFGVRHGDVLSGLVELETTGVPLERSVSATASLAAVAGKVAIPVSERFGVRATVNRSRTDLMFAVNGQNREFLSAPESRNASASATWEYRNGGRLKLYAYDEWNRFAVSVSQPSFEGAFDADDGSGVAVLSMRDAAGPIGVNASVSVSRRRQRQGFGSFLLDERDRLTQGRLELAALPATWLVARVGADIEKRVAAVSGSYPQTGEDVRPDARVTVFDSEMDADRAGVFAETELRPFERLEVTAGLRTDQSGLDLARTWDPRLNGAYRLSDDAFLTFSWGRYHQVPAPLLLEPVVGDPTLEPMAATHHVGGLVLGSGERVVRVEAYHKTQRRLAGTDRDHVARGGGSGRATGIDVFARGSAPLGSTMRFAYSWISAERTDPDTGVLATSPYEIPHSLVLVLERPLSERWMLGAALRRSSGRPYTPVVSARYDDETGVWTPVYGAPWSARLPGYSRLDVSSHFLQGFGDDGLLVAFVSVTNVLDRVNAAGVQYNPDYSEVRLLDSAYRRTLYFGVSMTLPF